MFLTLPMLILPRTAPRIYLRGRNVECLQRGISTVFSQLPSGFAFASFNPFVVLLHVNKSSIRQFCETIHRDGG